MGNKLRIVFMGTPEFSVGALRALIQSNHDVICVYTQPPRPKGRGQSVQKSPVHMAADDAGIEVRHPINFKNPDDVAAFENLNADVAVVAAYGLILPKSILNAPKHGCINIHASLLPRWRGAAPIQRSIMAGDVETGITIMQMDVGLDTGPMIAMERTAIDDKTTATSLHDSLSKMGADMIVPVMDELVKSGVLIKTPQPDIGMTYASMLKKEEGHIDWSLPSIQIHRIIRALNPWPSTYAFNQKGQRLKILKTTLCEDIFEKPFGNLCDNGIMICGDSRGLKLDIIQPENKKPMSIDDAIRGGYVMVGDKLK